MMTHLGVVSRLTSSWFLFAVAVVASSSRASADELRWFPGQFLVTDKHADGANPRTAALADDSDQKRFATIRRLSRGTTRLVTPRTPGSFVMSAQVSVGGESEPFNGDDGFCQKLLREDPTIGSCSPNYEVRALGTSNDPYFQNGSLWGLQGGYGIDATRAWDRTTGSKAVVVAVIDTGLDYNHPDLASNVWTNPGEIPGNGIDDDGNGYIDDLHGINAITGSGDPMDDNSHGTHVSGTIGAVGNNALGVVGINHHVQIIGLKFLNSTGAGGIADAIEAINYAVLMKKTYGVNIKVLNNSWGGGGFSQPLADAVEEARKADIIFTAAAGNESNDNDLSPSYPAGYSSPNVVSVAAIDKQGNLATFSNYGLSSVSIAAPGVGIVSTVTNGGYASYSGTSMATPHVSGALALLFASEPDLDMQSAVTRLYESGSQLATLSSVVRTSRTLNVGRLLANEVAPLPAPPPALAPCHYQMTKIPFAPDMNVMNAAVKQRADEASFVAITLPWEVDLYRTSVKSVTVSPNGVIYGRGNGSMDFKNSEKAPVNSIAALHTDLVAEATDLASGFRYLATDDVAWFYWRAKHYSVKDAGYVNVWAALHKDGRIQVFTKIDDIQVLEAVQKQATIGIAGGEASSYDTFAYNNSAIQSEMGVEFVSQCDGSRGEASTAVTKITASSTVKGKQITSGAKFKLGLHGTGTGQVLLNASIDGFSCTSTKSMHLADGTAQAVTTMPRNVSRSVTFTVGSATKVVKVKKGTARAKVRAARAAKACDDLFARIKQS